MRAKEKIPGLREKVLLKEYTTFKIGGPAEYFFIAKSKKNLIRAVEFSRENKIPLTVLGGGSNVLISDNGCKGLVVKIGIGNIEVKNFLKEKSVFLSAGAGASLSGMAFLAAKKGFSGLEWAAGIPGTIGGAVQGNAGAFGKEMRDIVEEVEYLDCERMEIKKIKKGKCEFSYRKSFFKKEKNKIITGAVLKLKKSKKEKTEKETERNLSAKKERQPINFFTAGSVFKNPKREPAWSLIEKRGLKGKKIGGVKFSEKHANFIVNFESGKAKDVKKAISLAKEKVKKREKINLEEEIQYICFH